MSGLIQNEIKSNETNKLKCHKNQKFVLNSVMKFLH